MLLFSVIIPTFNRLDLLRLTLESVRGQLEPPAEVIVVDDGSTDGTVEWLRSKRPDVTVIAQHNQGPGAARNRGIDRATGEYLAFLDSDDLWLPWTTRVYRQAFEASGAALLFGKPLRSCDEADLDDLPPPNGCPEWAGFDDYFSSGDEWRWWGASSFVVRRESLGDARFVEVPINGEDADWVMKLGHRVPLAQITGPVTFGYREHPENVMKNSAKTLAGAWNLVASEKAGRYPGGEERGRERRRILGRHVRPVILEAMREGPRPEARKLLAATLRWHLAERRFRFLMAAGLLSLRP